MSAAPDIAPSRPRLAQGSRLRWDEARQSWVVLAPERVILLDETAHEIVRRCDGSATVAEIVADLARSFEAEPGEVEGDVVQLIDDLTAKRILAP
ncbi:pyrroloquinoline quinone biosynthesis peptide chaperone PqqD [Inquilinus limosus]|uniref:Pyrroloquinoline quinone biosynthesis protein PqqD n=1 Tax=Inquilinus limosus TaxID=171674 RepID=A0A211ZSK1_9PROT|nr:pyrroloquinoline quinone biosynthesis peptide chaperone PqqD [Inquilinus limosus]OWJ68057.1 pyrroloquinoline quinone biosynthesis protein PqqD [Inquilinus limosus]